MTNHEELSETLALAFEHSRARPTACRLATAASMSAFGWTPWMPTIASKEFAQL
jgi:hypothetical protein